MTNPNNSPRLEIRRVTNKGETMIAISAKSRKKSCANIPDLPVELFVIFDLGDHVVSSFWNEILTSISSSVG